MARRKRPGKAIEPRAEKTSVWWIITDAPVARLFCWGDGQRLALMRCLIDDHMAWSEPPCTESGVTCFELEAMPRAFAVHEPNMPGFMEVMRTNGIRGHYRKAGEEQKYQF